MPRCNAVAVAKNVFDPFHRAATRSLTVAALSAIGLIALSAIPAAAQAPSVPTATFLGSGNFYCGVYVSLPTLSGPGNSSPDDCIVAGVTTAQATFTQSGTPDPLASATALALSSHAVGNAQVDYYLEIVGGSGMSPVTVDVSAYLSASSSGNAAGDASLTVKEVPSPNTAVGTWSVCADTEVSSGCTGVPDTTISLQTTVTMLSNTLYVVDLMAGAEVPGPFGMFGTGSSSGFVDPSFGIDSMTPDASDYSLDFSADIGNTFLGPPNPVPSSVPEPGSLALFGAALAGLGAIWRRKRS